MPYYYIHVLATVQILDVHFSLARVCKTTTHTISFKILGAEGGSWYGKTQAEWDTDSSSRKPILF
jgi:hypothetical protein